jgi:hypothetical protein
MMDWNAFREVLQTALLEATSADTSRPLRAVAFGGQYAETDGVIHAPILYLNTDGENMDSPPDWDTTLFDWIPAAWFEALTTEACSGTVPHWEETFARYQDVLVQG